MNQIDQRVKICHPKMFYHAEHLPPSKIVARSRIELLRKLIRILDQHEAGSDESESNVILLSRVGKAQAQERRDLRMAYITEIEFLEVYVNASG